MENGVYRVEKQVEVLVLGAGPAGMKAAIEACKHGVDVMLVDEQPTPGGQIWRAVEQSAQKNLNEVLGADYCAGLHVAQAFRQSRVNYQPLTQVWQIEAEQDGWQVYMSHEGRAHTVFAKKIILATGAQERPMPFPGWTLPGVLTVGAAQIALKTSAEIPAEPVWIAGSGPLVLLYIHQLLQAGGEVAGWIDTSPPPKIGHKLPLLFGALGSWRAIQKGRRWLKAIQAHGVPIYKNTKGFQALGEEKLQQIQIQQADGRTEIFPASVLLLHDGVIPSIHVTESIGCEHEWCAQQQCFKPKLDDWYQTTLPGVYVAGDGAGILGAEAALVQGQLVGLGVAQKLGHLSQEQAQPQLQQLEKYLHKERQLRKLLDALYPPRVDYQALADETIVCRCEELTAADIRAVLSLGTPGPNQVKSLTRAGMGPCQGRQCGYTVSGLIAAAQNKTIKEVGFYRVRPPLKPLTLGMLASLDEDAKP